jgi:hypothetical protein
LTLIQSTDFVRAIFLISGECARNLTKYQPLTSYIYPHYFMCSDLLRQGVKEKWQAPVLQGVKGGVWECGVGVPQDIQCEMSSRYLVGW